LTVRKKQARPVLPEPEAPRTPTPSPWRPVKDGLLLSVRLTPKASRDEVGAVGDGPDGAHVAVKVRALPSDGEANAALARVVAKWLGLTQRNVTLAAGGKSRLKSLHLAGGPAELSALLQAKLAANK
jgi:uncharacterized protein (TIGR00251 family)